MFPDAGPTARALLALEAIQARPGITATQLADRLQVSERAARRAVSTLREAGVPVDSTRGPYGGYRLGRGLRLPPLVFQASEALGLVMAVLDGAHAAADPGSPVGSGLGKLIDALPSTVARQADLMRSHVRASADRRATRPDPETTTALVAAVAEQRQVELSYTSGSGTTWQEIVDPWAVVVRYGLWYLLCRSHRADAVRTYRVDRVSGVSPRTSTFAPPADLDAVALLEEHLAQGWAHPVSVIVDAPAAEVQPWLRATMGTLSELPDEPGRCRLDGSTNNPELYAREWLAALPFDVHVVDSPELAAAVARLARRLSAAVPEETS